MQRAKPLEKCESDHFQTLAKTPLPTHTRSPDCVTSRFVSGGLVLLILFRRSINNEVSALTTCLCNTTNCHTRTSNPHHLNNIRCTNCDIKATYYGRLHFRPGGSISRHNSPSSPVPFAPPGVLPSTLPLPRPPRSPHMYPSQLREPPHLLGRSTKVSRKPNVMVFLVPGSTISPS